MKNSFTSKHNSHIQNTPLPRNQFSIQNPKTTSSANTTPAMPKKYKKPSSKSPKKYASKNLGKLKAQSQKAGKKTSNIQSKSNTKLRTKKPNKHVNNNKKARRFSLISDESVDDDNDDDDDEDEELSENSLNVAIQDYESESDDDDDDDDEDDYDSSSSESDADVDFVKLTAQRKKRALKAVKGLKTTGMNKKAGKSTSTSTSQTQQHSKQQTNGNADEDSDINFSFEFESEDEEENEQTKLEKEDVGEEIKSTSPSNKAKTSNKPKYNKARLSTLERGSILPVPKINEDSDSPLSEVDSSENENAILTDSSDDEEYEKRLAKSAADAEKNEEDDEQDIDNDKLAAAIAADENDPADAYDDETLAQKKKLKLSGLRNDDDGNNHTVLSDDDELLDKETANLLEQMKTENDLYFMNNDFPASPDFFLTVGQPDDILSNHRNSIVPRLSIVEDPKDVVLREKLRKKVALLKDDNDDDDEVIEFVSDDDEKNKSKAGGTGNGNFYDDDDDDDDENEASDLELSLFDDLYYKPSVPFNLGIPNSGNKYLDAYDQTGDDAFFWDYLLGDDKKNININSSNNDNASGNLLQRTGSMSMKRKQSRSKSTRRSVSRKFSNQHHPLVNQHNKADITIDNGVSANPHSNVASTSKASRKGSTTMIGGINFDLALGTNESFMDYQAFFSEDDDELTDEEENLPVSSAKNIGSRSVKEVLSSAKVNGGGAPRMATWIAAKDRPFEIIDGLSTRSILPYSLKNSGSGSLAPFSSIAAKGGKTGIGATTTAMANNTGLHKRNVSVGSDLKFDEFFNLSELEENVDDNVNWSALTSSGSLNKRKVPLTAFRNRGHSLSNSSTGEFTRRFSNNGNLISSLSSSVSKDLGSNNASNSGTPATTSALSASASPVPTTIPVPVHKVSSSSSLTGPRPRASSKVRHSRGLSISKSNKIRKNLKQSVLKPQAKDSKFIIDKPSDSKAKKRRQSSVAEATQEGLVFTDNGLFSENVLTGVEEFLMETGDFENDELSGLLSGIQF